MHPRALFCRRERVPRAPRLGRLGCCWPALHAQQRLFPAGVMPASRERTPTQPACHGRRSPWRQPRSQASLPPPSPSTLEEGGGVTDFHRLPPLSPLFSSFSPPHRWRLPLRLRRRLVSFSFSLPFSSVARAACCAAVCPGRVMVNRCAAVVAAPPPSPSSLQAEGCRRRRGRRGRRVQTGGERGAPDPLRRAA